MGFFCAGLGSPGLAGQFSSCVCIGVHEWHPLREIELSCSEQPVILFFWRSPSLAEKSQHHLHFTAGETEARSGQAPCPRSHRESAADLGTPPSPSQISAASALLSHGSDQLPGSPRVGSLPHPALGVWGVFLTDSLSRRSVGPGIPGGGSPVWDDHNWSGLKVGDFLIHPSPLPCLHLCSHRSPAQGPSHPRTFPGVTEMSYRRA